MQNSLISRRVTISDNSSSFHGIGGKIVGYENNLYVISLDNSYNDIITCNEDQFRLFGSK